MRRREFVQTVGAGIGITVPGAGPWIRDGRRRVPRADLVLTGALVYDGSGESPREVDVAIAGDRIAAVGAGLSAPEAETVRLDGLALAPGFIDIHSHTDLELAVGPEAESKIRQGVTTEVAGQDGGSIGPWGEERAAEIHERYRAEHGVELDFHDLAGFFRWLDAHPSSVNLASMVGHGTVREFVIGTDDRPATPDELERMAALVQTALTDGACGLSSGLEYVPGAFADSHELIAVAAPLRGTGLPYTSHIRNEDDHLLGALEEALTVGRQAEVAVHVSHLKAQGERNWWKAEPALYLIEVARSHGQDVTFDRYPYVAFSTGLGSLFPVWAREGGTDALLARLGDSTLRPSLEAAVRDKIEQLGTWDAVQVAWTESSELGWAEGGRLGTLAADRQVDPYALLVQLTTEDRNKSGMVGFGMSEENTARFLAHPLGMVCSDGSALATAGPLADGTPHPRSFGTFPRVLGHYCRTENLMPLETAIRKMTGMPARRVGLRDRGRIAEGAFADLVAFDPATVADRATFGEPHHYPVGIPHVMVNGSWVIRNGEHTGARPGRTLRAGAS